jgi:hypothetical protein
MITLAAARVIILGHVISYEVCHFVPCGFSPWSWVYVGVLGH